MVFMTAAENIDVAPLDGSTAGRAGMNHTLEAHLWHCMASGVTSMTPSGYLPNMGPLALPS